MNLWSKLEDIYNNFNARLKQQGISYEGAIYREVIEQKTLDLPHKHYLFIGFNLLQKVEQELFNIIKKEGKAKFYWDFDKYYTTNNQQEAGYYINNTYLYTLMSLTIAMIRYTIVLRTRKTSRTFLPQLIIYKPEISLIGYNTTIE